MIMADLIFVTNNTYIISGDKIVMWRNVSFPCVTIVEKFQLSPYDRCGEIIWHVCDVENVAIYAKFMQF